MANQVEASQDRRKQPLRLSKAEVIGELSACMALVRPVTMSDDAVKEWLAVAANEVRGMRPTTFKAGCAEARKECTHHGQIIPKILNGKAAQGWRDMGLTPFLEDRGQEQPLQINQEMRGLIEDAAKGCKP